MNYKNKSLVSNERIKEIYLFLNRIKLDKLSIKKIRLNSSAGTGHFYTTTKNKKTMPDKLEIKKFDPTIRKYVMYKEAKIK